MMWNKLTSPELTPGQQLMIYYPSEVIRYRPQKTEILESLPLLSILDIEFNLSAKKTTRKLKPQKQEFIYHRLKRYESLQEAADKYNGVTVREIMDWNNFTKKTMPKTGASIKIYVK